MDTKPVFSNGFTAVFYPKNPVYHSKLKYI